MRRALPLKVQAGGGLRTAEQIQRLLDGRHRARGGRQPRSAKPHPHPRWLQRFGADRVVFALDVRVEQGVARVDTAGWQGGATMPLNHLLDAYADTALRPILCTDISRDGMLQGPNVELYRSLRAASLLWSCWRRAAWGAGRPRRPASLQVAGAIVGKALYEGRFTLAQALAVAASRRIIPCLDVKDGVVVKGVRFREHQVLGDVLELAQRYRDEGADELVFYDITASVEGRTVRRTGSLAPRAPWTFPSAWPAASAAWPTRSGCSTPAPTRSRSTRPRWNAPS